MKRIKPRLEEWFPVGLRWEAECVWTGAGLGCAGLLCLCLFAYRFGGALDGLYTAWPKRALIPGATVPPFPQMLGRAPLGFAVVALCLAAAAALHYAWHFQGSRSIYLMRRLPQRWELWRRCLAGPLAGLACCALAAGASALLCFIIYWFRTPAGHLPPDIWGRIGGTV